jgi:hypothetical protein
MGSRCLNIALLYILCQSGERFSDLKVLMFGSRAQKPPESIHLHVPPEIRRQVYSSTQIASARRYRGAFRISAIIAYCSTWLQSSSMPRWISPKGLLCQEPRALMKHSSLLTFQGMLPKRHLTFVESACKDIMMRFWSSIFDESYLVLKQEGQITYADQTALNHSFSKVRLKVLIADVDVCSTQAILVRPIPEEGFGTMHTS